LFHPNTEQKTAEPAQNKNDYVTREPAVLMSTPKRKLKEGDKCVEEEKARKRGSHNYVE